MKAHIVLLAALCAASVHAADGQYRKIGDTACSAWTASDGLRFQAWTGACRDGIADGHGVLTGEYRDDKGAWRPFRIEGSLKGGKRSGFLRAEFEGAGSYAGQFREGLLEGWAVQRLPDGSSYEGQWHNNLRHGVGTYTTASGSVLHARWVDGAPVGPWQRETRDGKSWAIVDEHRDGTARAAFDNDGEIEAGGYRLADNRLRREGRGVFWFARGSFYMGDFAGNLPNGTGVFVTRDKGNAQDATVYAGQFHDGCLWRGDWYTNVIVAADSCKRR